MWRIAKSLLQKHGETKGISLGTSPAQQLLSPSSLSITTFFTSPVHLQISRRYANT